MAVPDACRCRHGDRVEAPGRPLTQLPALAAIGSSSADTDEERLQKRLLVASTLMMASLAVVWGGLYLAFGEPLAASIPLGYAAASFASLAVFARVRRYGLFRVSQLTLSLVLPFLLMLVLGGFVASSAVVLWSLTSPLGALVFAGRRRATGWFVAYVGLIILGAGIAPGLDNDLPDALVTTFFVLNLTGVSVVAFVLLQYFVGERDLALTVIDRERSWIRDAFSSYISPNLVRHLIEHPDELRPGGERRDCTFVLSDLAGFTSLVEQVEPERVVALLNEYLDEMTRIALAEDGTLDRRSSATPSRSCSRHLLLKAGPPRCAPCGVRWPWTASRPPSANAWPATAWAFTEPRSESAPGP